MLALERRPKTEGCCPSSFQGSTVGPRGAGGGGGIWDGLGRAARHPRALRSGVCSPGDCAVGAWTPGRARSGTSGTGGGLGEGRGGGEGAPAGLWDGERRRGLEPPETAPRGFLQVSPEGVGDEDSCSSSAPLSPSSSPRSMASGSVCPPGKCVCSSCGLEIVDKYLLKVGRSREAQGKRGSPGSSGEGEKFIFPFFSTQVLARGCRLSYHNRPVKSNS